MMNNCNCLRSAPYRYHNQSSHLDGILLFKAFSNAVSHAYEEQGLYYYSLRRVKKKRLKEMNTLSKVTQMVSSTRNQI